MTHLNTLKGVWELSSPTLRVVFRSYTITLLHRVVLYAQIMHKHNEKVVFGSYHLNYCYDLLTFYSIFLLFNRWGNNVCAQLSVYTSLHMELLCTSVCTKYKSAQLCFVRDY